MKVEFLTSALLDKYPETGLSEVLILGRSNVGKSSFINAITNSRIARSSSTPGRTRLLNFFKVDNKYVLVDAPGYGYASVNKQQQVEFIRYIDQYLQTRDNLKLVIVLVDSRIALTQYDYMMFDGLHEMGKKFIVIGTKADKLNQKMMHQHKVNIAEAKTKYQFDYFLTSIHYKSRYEQVINYISSYIKLNK